MDDRDKLTIQHWEHGLFGLLEACQGCGYQLAVWSLFPSPSLSKKATQSLLSLCLHTVRGTGFHVPYLHE